MRNLDRVFSRLAQSTFRQGFHLGQRERAYLKDKGLAVVLEHASAFVDQRLAPAAPVNDGKQTPFRGHPVFIAQHATGTCCRSCLEKWHGIPAGRELDAAERDHVVAAIGCWLRNEGGEEYHTAMIAASPPMALPPPALSPLEVTRILAEPAAAEHPRGRAILARFPDAERVTIASHWNIPALHGDADQLDSYVRTKRSVLVLGVKKTLAVRPNGRSADFIAPSHSNGCAMACAYCYVSRRKGYANPITTFVNIDGIAAAIARHAGRLGPKPDANQVDPLAWVYDVGENGDCSVDALISDNVRDLTALFRRLPNAKGSFATKHVNRKLLDYDPAGRMRIRFSLMPAELARTLDVRAAPIPERIAAIEEFVRAGWEVHLNFSPVVVYEGWTAAYAELFQQVDAALSERARAQIAAEVIFLTHNEELHDLNLRWHPKAEERLWTPRWQEPKRSENGAVNVRYRAALKGRMIAMFRELLTRHMPYCRVRYAF